MKKILFGLLTFLFCFNVAYAHVEDVQFVGGTGGSKILELNVEDNKVDTSGVIYDRNASLVYEISYTNESDTKKKITDIKLPEIDILLTYDFSNVDLDKIIDVGETVKFQYSIKAEENLTHEQLESLNEVANAQLVFTSIIDNPIDNPNTIDIIVLVLISLIFSFVLFLYTKKKKSFYVFFISFLVGISFLKTENVIASDEEILDINTGIKYIFSNLAPSCANLDYEGNFCIDWKQYGNRDLVHYLVMEDSKEMSDTYTIGDVSFSLESQYDVSEQQNGDVVLGIYKALVEEESYLFLVGQDGGVIVPKDASYQFTSYDVETNKHEYDFHYVKYADFSNFYSNKTTNMSYMLTGIGARVNMEKIDLSGFETSNVTDMSGMFVGVGEYTKNFKLDLEHFNTSKVTNMSKMFFETAFYSDMIDLDLSTFDTSNVVNMNAMFRIFGANAKNINLDIYNWDTSSVTDMSYMFSGFANYSEYTKIDYFKDWDTSNVTDMEGMFTGILVLPSSINYDNYLEIELSGLDTKNVESMSSLFWYNTRIRKIDMSMLDTSNLKDMNTMFAYTLQLQNVKFGDNFNTSNVTGFSGLFSNSGVYNTIDEIDMSMFDFYSALLVDGMFRNCGVKNLKISNKGFENVSSVAYIFNDLPLLTNLDLSEFNFGHVTDYTGLFSVRDSYIGKHVQVIDLSGSDWNEDAIVTDMFKNIKGSTIYVKDEKAKAFIEKQAPDCTVLIKE